MIYTVTLNPSVDYYMKTDKTVFSDVNRISEYSFIAAGKGINCSKILDVLSIPSETVYFSGGRTGDFINEELAKHSFIKINPIDIDGLTRVNVKIYGSVDNAFNPSGPVINDDAKKALMELLKNKVRKEDAVIISGSLPRGCDTEYLKELCRIIGETGAKIILDVPGIRLEDYKAGSIYLIKPNIDELQEIIGKEELNGEYQRYLQMILDCGVENILLSLGSKGALYKGKQGEYTVKIPEVEVIKSIGAGDAMLGAFVGTLVQSGDIEKSLKMAAGAGVATVSCEEMPSRGLIEEMAEKTVIIKGK